MWRKGESVQGIEANDRERMSWMLYIPILGLHSFFVLEYTSYGTVYG